MHKTLFFLIVKRLYISKEWFYILGKILIHFLAEGIDGKNDKSHVCALTLELESGVD